MVCWDQINFLLLYNVSFEFSSSVPVLGNGAAAMTKIHGNKPKQIILYSQNVWRTGFLLMELISISGVATVHSGTSCLFFLKPFALFVLSLYSAAKYILELRGAVSHLCHWEIPSSTDILWITPCCVLQSDCSGSHFLG